MVRIIPARAGFTRNFGWENLYTKDHPRSRGVYDAHVIGAFVHGGSSPLARGLLTSDPHPPRSRRIIPARAGFTLLEIANQPR